MVKVGVEWVNSFPFPCNQNQLANCDDTSVGFLNGMTSRGHTQGFNWGDGNAWERDFRDTSDFGGDDRNVTDSVDFVHFSSHGSTSNNVYRGYFGAQRDACTWTSTASRFGEDFNVEWLALDTCNSIELTQNVISTWRNTFQGMHQVFGFTDLVSDTPSRGYAFGRRAGNNEVLSTAWLDEGYSWWYTDYPVAMAAGRNQADACNRLDNERVGSSFDDVPNSQIGWFQWKWRS
jgi:hypothetical protein